MTKVDMREKPKTIEVLHYMNGFVPGTIIGPDHVQYECFSVWAEHKSTTTENDKAVQICKFVEEKEPEKEKDKDDIKDPGKAANKVDDSVKTAMTKVGGFHT